MKEIILSRGLIALVDDEDYERINKHKWYAIYDPKGRHFYAQRKIRLPDGRRTSLNMHREVLGLAPGDGAIADHKDISQTLDNRKQNLRVADLCQSNWNQNTHRDGTSGYKFVSWDKFHCHWRVRIVQRGKTFYGGSFIDKEQARIRSEELVKQLRGEFAVRGRSKG